MKRYNLLKCSLEKCMMYSIQKKTVKIFMVIILMFVGSLLFSKRFAILPEIMRPYSFAVDGNHLYIGEQSNVSLYSLKSFKFVKKFGNRGEGPGELKSIPFLEIFPKYLVVNCFGKLLFFSRDGKYINEIRTPSITTVYVYPVGKNFVGLTGKINKIERAKSFSIDLFDKDMKFIKEIARIEKKQRGKKTGKRQIEAIKDYFKHKVYDEYIYVANTNKGFFIEVFDSMGNKLYEINKEYEKVKITDEYKEDYIKRKNNSKDFLDKMVKSKYRYVFRDYFPAFSNFIVKDGEIYVFTHKRVGEKKELIILDLKGSILKKTFITARKSNFYSISNNKYYFLEENEKTEDWELFVEDL